MLRAEIVERPPAQPLAPIQPQAVYVPTPQQQLATQQSPVPQMIVQPATQTVVVKNIVKNYVRSGGFGCGCGTILLVLLVLGIIGSLMQRGAPEQSSPAPPVRPIEPAGVAPAPPKPDDAAEVVFAEAPVDFAKPEPAKQAVESNGLVDETPAAETAEQRAARLKEQGDRERRQTLERRRERDQRKRALLSR